MGNSEEFEYFRANKKLGRDERSSKSPSHIPKVAQVDITVHFCGISLTFKSVLLLFLLFLLLLLILLLLLSLPLIAPLIFKENFFEETLNELNKDEMDSEDSIHDNDVSMEERMGEV